MEDLIKQRGTIKGKLTRIEKYIIKIQELGDNPRTLKQYIEKADNAYEDYEKVHLDIIKICEMNHVIDHEIEFEEFEEKIIKAKTTLEDWVEAKEIADTSTTGSSGSSTLSANRPARQNVTADIKLPKLDLPTFNGNFQSWISFRDLFVSTIHNNAKLSGAQKLQYLKVSLKDEAAVLLQSLQITNDNYEEAWNILNQRYQKKREIIRSHLKRFFGQAIIQTESAEALRKLLDTSTECLRSLKVLNLPVEHWDAIIVYIITGKLDPESNKQWALSQQNDDLPTWKMLSTFMDLRADALAASAASQYRANNKSKSNGKPQTNPGKQAQSVHHGSTYKPKCSVCSQEHSTYKCEQFNKMTMEERKQTVKDKNLCYNCLYPGHAVLECKSRLCNKCNKKHNSLLHYDKPASTQQPPEDKPQNQSQQSQAPPQSDPRASLFVSEICESKPMQTLLATIKLQIKDKRGIKHDYRALLDMGSQISIVTERLVQHLGLKKYKMNVPINGLASVAVGNSNSLVKCNLLSPINENTQLELQALVLPRITAFLPNNKFDPTDWDHIKGLQLADPKFNKPGPIDLLLGADVYNDIITGTRIKGRKGLPQAWETIFGWVLCGKMSDSPDSSLNVNFAQADVNSILHKFWELEEPSALNNPLTSEEEECENHFVQTHYRDEEGKYHVRLPFKADREELGFSRPQAVSRLQNQERRFVKDSKLHQEYNSVLQEYVDLGHMEEVPAEDLDKDVKECYYMPHHGVFKDTSTTTKLRVVFDASAKSSTGISLNDNLMVGPKLQDDILPMLLRFRTHQIAMTADIAKMYRQFNVYKDEDYQRIVFRKSPREDIKDYRLLTATFGTAAAPYLAVRCLQQLARDESPNFPLASKTLLKDLYVDDLLTGAKDTQSALQLQKELLGIMDAGRLELRKWASNATIITDSLPVNLRETTVQFPLDANESVKTLGLHWNTAWDTFSFRVTLPPAKAPATKRTLLSDMARTFDPIGFLAPIIIAPKILFQELWKLKCNWDDPLPHHIQQQWEIFRSELPSIEDIKIPRCLSTPSPTSVRLYGFCDASEKAYAAVIYSRSVSNNGNVTVRLVTGKTKVAPVQQESLPRLELCSALLLSEVLKTLQDSAAEGNETLEAIKDVDKITCFSDSTTVLAWLSSQPRRWKTFVANRVAKIQAIVPSLQWHHVRGEDNPADCASRGIPPSALKNHPLWWLGPNWLQEPEEEIKTRATSFSKQKYADLDVDLFEERIKASELPYSVNVSTSTPHLDQRDVECRNWVEEIAKELKDDNSVTVSHVTTNTPRPFDVIQKYSSLSRLKIITAILLRFIHNAKVKDVDNKLEGPITVKELNNAFICCIRIVQHAEFSEDISRLKGKTDVKHSSKLRHLNPLLDEDGLIRVGGRIGKSSKTPDQKQPIVLPKKHHLTQLTVKFYHFINGHAAPQLLLAAISQRFWIIGGADVCRLFVLKCVTCHKSNPKMATQLMGDLPTDRVNPSRPFLKTGVDYAGPLTILKQARATRNSPKSTEKAYVALFVCFATHAIHLELVSDLTTEAFLAALKRFIARRGKPSHIYSDCGTNFVGAHNELKDLNRFVSNLKNNKQFNNQVTQENITWKFNPPGAPHFGGLWEAGVKSMKLHLRRIIGPAHLTFEQMTTLLTEIEACLNSRPLTPISTDPSDLSVLTPGHFLIGEALTAIPESDYKETKENRLSKWQKVQKLYQHFWQRWSSEYLSRLQHRPKWCQRQENLKIGDIVIIKEEDLPPQKWQLGRIQQVHPGADGLVRAATIKTQTGVYKRPTGKLSLLPFENQEEVQCFTLKE